MTTSNRVLEYNANDDPGWQHNYSRGIYGRYKTPAFDDHEGLITPCTRTAAASSSIQEMFNLFRPKKSPGTLQTDFFFELRFQIMESYDAKPRGCDTTTL